MNRDETKNLPRGRQTIRKNGSLLGFHGPVSRRIKLFTADANHNTTIAQLERAYFAALESVDLLDERVRQDAASGRFTSAGMKADALQFALHDLLPRLHSALETIARAKAELAERKAKVNQPRDGGSHQDVAEINELEEAIAAAESATAAAHEVLRIETGVVNEHDLNGLAASIEQKPQAPWLRRRRDANGTEQIRVVDLGRKIERLATPEEAERGVFYESYDEYQKGKSA